MTFSQTKTWIQPQGLKLCLAFGLMSCMGSAAAVDELTSTTLSVSTVGHDRFFAVTFDANGNSYAAGSVASSAEKGADSRFLVAKFAADGKLDTSFGSKGYSIINFAVGADGEVARGIAVQSTGKIIVAGSVEHAGATDARDRDLVAARLNPDGSLDKEFGSSGIAIYDLSEGLANGSAYVADTFGGLVLDAQDRLVIEAAQKRKDGLDTDFVLLRTDSNGHLDANFGDQGIVSLDIRNLSASPKTPVVLPDGQILGTGYMRDGNTVLPVLYKVDSNGKLNTSFGQAGIFSQPILGLVSEVYAVTLQGTSLVTVGYGRDNEQESLDFLSIRVTADGRLDPTFGTGGYARIDVDGFNDNGRNLTTLPGGRLLLIGGGRYTSANVDGMLVVLNPDGTPDESFGENGTRLVDFGGSNDFLWGVAVSPSKDRVVAVGIKGIGTDAGNDDAALVNITLK